LNGSGFEVFLSQLLYDPELLGAQGSELTFDILFSARTARVFCAIRGSASLQRVALGSPSQSLGEDAQAETA
jgi:hypothetical protein